MKPFKVAVRVGLLVGVVGLAGGVLAQWAGYEITRYRVGGGWTSGGSYGLSAFIGQADAGLLAGGGYTVAGGFGGGAAAGLSPRPSPTPPAFPASRLHLPFIVR